MRSILRLSDEQYKATLGWRHIVGTIYENLYRFSLVIAFAALLILLIQISSQAIGPVLFVPLNPVEGLADLPLNELSEDELATIIVRELDSGVVNVVRDQLGSVEGAEFLSVPLAQSLPRRQLPEGISRDDAQTLTYGELTSAQIAELLALNRNRAQLTEIIEKQVIGEDVILEWAWYPWVFNRDLVYNESALELGGELARGILREVPDIFTAEDLAPGLEPIIGAENSPTVAADYFRLQELFFTYEDWDIDRRRVLASGSLTSDGRSSFTAQDVTRRVSRDLIPDIQQVVEAAGVPAFAAAQIATSFAPEIAATRDGKLTELSGTLPRDLLSSLMAPNFATRLRNGEYNGATIEFRSWLTWGFVTERGQNSTPELASIRVAALGSIWLVSICILVAFPLGVGAAIYLEEYASDNWLNNLIETNIRNLSGVPSIIYGLLGLAVFVRAFGFFTSGEVFGSDSENGRTIISAGFTLALLILPVIIINSQEALRAVPSTIREASYGLGGTKWQTIWRQVLPAAVPGILTGTILSLSRAVGEAGPLLVVGASTAISADPNLFSGFTAVPIQIYNWTEDSRPEYQHLAAAAIVVLLIILIAMNTVAITLRNRYSKQLA
ncbi:MAG: phosphate ABC transporter permease PstA [Phototrophicaceae bacterium]|jgi:phosphate ABC transporter permease subunit PstA